LRYCFAWLMVDFRALLLDSDIRHKRRRYSRGQNIGIAKVEFANCQSEAMSYWNISWLRDDFYLRALLQPWLKGLWVEGFIPLSSLDAWAPFGMVSIPATAWASSHLCCNFKLMLWEGSIWDHSLHHEAKWSLPCSTHSWGSFTPRFAWIIT
jgi:hypothetical protein